MSSLSHAKGVFGADVKFMVGGVETTEYNPMTFYGGKLIGKLTHHKDVYYRH